MCARQPGCARDEKKAPWESLGSNPNPGCGKAAEYKLPPGNLGRAFANVTPPRVRFCARKPMPKGVVISTGTPRGYTPREILRPPVLGKIRDFVAPKRPFTDPETFHPIQSRAKTLKGLKIPCGPWEKPHPAKGRSIRPQHGRCWDLPRPCPPVLPPACLPWSAPNEPSGPSGRV